MKLSRTSTLLFACLLAGVAGCESSKSGTNASAGGAGAGVVEPAVVEPVVLREVPLPPGVAPEDLAPRAGTALTKAKLPLANVLDDLPKPMWAMGASTRPSTQPDEPPLQAQKAYMQAKADIRDGRYYEAISKLTEANRLAPGSPDILRSLGEANLLSGNSVRAANFYQQVVEQIPNDFDSLFMLGNIAIEQGNWVTAVWAYHKVLSQPARAGTTDQAVIAVSSYNIAGALEKLGYDQGAVEALDKVLNTQDADLRASGRVNRQTRALRAQKDAILISIGDANCRLGKPDKSIEYYKRALITDDEAPVPIQAYPRLLYAQLRASQKIGAQSTVMDLLSAGRFDAPTIALVDYYTKNGGDLSALQSRLEAVYTAKGKGAELAIAISRLMQNPQRREFLFKHLRAKPQDAEVLEEITRDITASQTKLAGNPALTKDLLLAAGATIVANPERAPGTFNRLKFVDPDGAAIIPMAQSLQNEPGVGFIAAGYLAELGKTNEAIAAYQKVVAQSPDLLAARLALVRLLVTSGDVNAAAKAIQPVESQDKSGVTQLRVMILIAQNKPKDALALVNKLLDTQPGNVELTVQRAELQFALGDAAAAERTLLDGIDQKPTTEIYYERLFDLYDSGRINDGQQQYVRLLRRLMGTLPQSRLNKILQARRMFAGAQNQQAVEILQQLLRQDPKDGGALSVLLEAHVFAGRTEEANQIAAKAVTDFPSERDVLIAVRNHYLRTQQTELAYNVTEKALALEPASPSRSVQYARLYIARKQFDKALKVLQPALAEAHEPVLSDVRMTLAQVYLLTKQPASAQGLAAEVLIANADSPEIRTSPGIVILASALAADKTKTAQEKIKFAQNVASKVPAAAADILDRLATMFESRGERESAQIVRVEGLKHNPTHPGLNNNLAYVWAVEGVNLEKALVMIETTLAQEPDVDSYIDTKGWILYKSGKFKEAVAELRRANKRGAADSSVVIDHLGDALWRMGQKAEATKVWRQAVVARQREKQREETMRRSGAIDPEFDATSDNDPEMKTIDARLQAKIKAAEAGQNAPVAPLGQGVKEP
jgi:tetratricopeptide (TPR) repeat protein